MATAPALLGLFFLVQLVLVPAADSGSNLRGATGQLRPSRPVAAAAPFNASALAGASHLVVVAGHAVTMSEGLDGVEREDAVWYLLPYQRGQDLPGTFVEHIENGVKLAASDPDALLVFSGGQTRADAGPRSEGGSYWLVAQHFGWWGHSEVSARATVEEHAKDSFQNLLFSMCRFREVTGRYPTRITVVGYSFKEARFRELHAAALKFPTEAFRYVGLQPAADSRFDLAAARQGEFANAVELFRRDPYGCHDPVLKNKRQARDPFHRTEPYLLACPEIGELLRWCGPSLFASPLPWEHLAAPETRHW